MTHKKCGWCGAPFYKLSDWVDGKPDAWDYMAVLIDNKAEVNYEPEFGWSVGWAHGCMGLGPTDYVTAHKAAALFVELWLRGVSASFADKIVQGFIMWEEFQNET